MKRSKYWLTCGVLAMLVSACSGPVVKPVKEDSQSVEVQEAPVATRTITMTKGDSLGVRVSTEGDVDITLTIIEGKPDAGVYTSEDKTLLEIARYAENALGDPNTTVSVKVDAAGQIVSIVHSLVLGGDGESR